MFLLLLKIMQKSTRVELELINKEIEEIDEAMEVGIHQLTWNSESNFSLFVFSGLFFRLIWPFERRHHGLFERAAKASRTASGSYA